MGHYVIECLLGFVPGQVTAVGEGLERQLLGMQRCYRGAHGAFLEGLERLHDAVDAALLGDGAAHEAALGAGVGHLEACTRGVERLHVDVEELSATLVAAKRQHGDDWVVRREGRFAVLEYAALRAELVARRALLDDGALWSEVVSRMRMGGSVGGVQLVAHRARELQEDLQAFVAGVEKVRAVPGLRARAEQLHDNSVAVGTLVADWTRLTMQCSYVAMICDRASQLAIREEAAAAVRAS